MSQDPVVVELVRRVANLEDDLMRQTARISVPVSGAFFSAYANAPTALSAGVTATVALGATTYTDGNFNTSTSTYTCPVAGHYLFSGCLNLTTTAAGAIYVALYQNSTEWRGQQMGGAAAGTVYGLTVAKVLQCTAGDIVTLKGYASGAATGSATAVTYLTGQIQ